MKPLEATYWDTCDVFELEKIKEKSITKQDWVLKQQGIKCALSKNKMPQSGQTESEHQIVGEFTLFMDDTINIKAGSKILCRGYDLRCGEPLAYPGSHQEIPCYLEKRG